MAAVALPDWLDFQPRLFPSCNFAWLRGPQPVLVDSGFGTDTEATLARLPDEPALVFNTHWHSDHVGGNAGLANRFGMPIAASVTDGSRVNAGDPESFGSAWLDQPVDPFHVDRLVEPGEMPYLLTRRWVHDFASLAGLPAEEFAERVVSDLLRSGAARWQDDRLISTVPHSRVSS
jgi:glyoxylase-like metal-dependent hydrolase (beta-lactamase superfamily II)